MRSPAIIGFNESVIGADLKTQTDALLALCSPSQDIKHSEHINCRPVLQSIDNVVNKQWEEDSAEDFNNLDSDLIEKIVAQIEFYFSEENLIKDEFIQKHIRRNKEGFVSLKLLSSLRKMKVLTKNWNFVAHCVKVGSKKLELNDNDTKVRRRAPLVVLDGDKYSRTVIACNLLSGNDSIDDISRKFSQFGDIALIRLLKSGSTSYSAIPANQLKIISNKYDLSKTTIATIEFSSKSSAEEAIRHFLKKRSLNNWRNNSIEVMAMKNIVSNKPIGKSNDNSDVMESRKTFYNNYKNSEESSVCERRHQFKRPLFQRQKSKSYSSGDEKKVFGQTIQLNSNQRMPVNVIRMPLGPDGTNGFRRSHRSNSEPFF